MIFKKHKYSAQKTEVDGITFPSKLEANVYSILLLKKKSGVIAEIERQVPVILHAGIKMIVDFKVTLKDGSVEYIEAKGMETPVWRLKLKLWKADGPAPLNVWKASGKRVENTEVVLPIKKEQK